MNHIKMPHLLKYRTVKTDNSPDKKTGPTSFSRIQWICITAFGIAMFVVLTLCLQVPVFENYYLCLGYIAMSIWLYSVGTASGTIAGVVGVVFILSAYRRDARYARMGTW